jgi:N-methylhydantoinase A
MKRVGIDIGGTFTDVLVLDELSGAVTWHKVPSTSRDASVGVLDGLAATGLAGTDIRSIKHGTTIGVNALLTSQGSRTGLITTAGFRDVLEIRRTHRKRLFDLNERVPRPLVPRFLRAEVAERIAADGTVVTPIDIDEVRRAWQDLEAEGVESLAIVFLFSFENPEHEQSARDVVMAAGVPSEAISVSSEVLPTYREYERTSTTVVNAFIAKPVREYLAHLSKGLRDAGLRDGGLLAITNTGGAITPSAMAARPIRAIMSGPAAGVVGALWLADKAGLRNVITMDMGGTSCDVSGVFNGVPDERLDMDIGGFAISTPALDVQTVGAGGGSIAWIDAGGALRVGPQSAGSDPGPVCYGRGGTEPTVTDANLVLGYYDPSILLGEVIAVDRARAEQAIGERIAEPLRLSLQEAAAGIIRIVNSHMLNAVHVASVERGRDPRDFALVAFGGAGAAHAVEIARELGITRVLIPPFPGCTSAFGAAITASRYDFVHSLLQLADDLDLTDLNARLADLTSQADRSLSLEGLEDAAVHHEAWLEVRYQGQAHNLTVELLTGNGTATEASLSDAIDRFHTMHDRLYGHAFADVPVELVNLHVRGVSTPKDVELKWRWGRSRPISNGHGTRQPSRKVYSLRDGAYLDTPIYFREELGPDAAMPVGPCVIHQTDATIVVPPGFRVIAHPTGSLLIEEIE